MPPRRSHKKSRAGCRRCKSRKIKCDEVHPRCGNCVKHGVPCDFEHATAATSASGRRGSSTPAASTPSPAAASPSSPRSRVSSVPRDDAPLCRTPSSAALSATTPVNARLLELKLMHQYTALTCKTLTFTAPVTEELWKTAVPQVALSGAQHLTDAVLAVAALHMLSMCPGDRDLVRASHAYMAASLAEYSATLSKGIDATNAEALFLTSTLIATQSSATRALSTRDEPTYAMPLAWLHAFQGVKAVIAASWPFLRHSPVATQIINSQAVLQLDLEPHGETFFGHLLEGLDEGPETVEPERLSASESHIGASQPGGPPDAAMDDARLLAPLSPTAMQFPANRTRQAYQHAVAVLNWAHKIPHRGAPLAFPATVSRRFVELLEAKDPRALVILACFFALLRSVDGAWWLHGLARREVLGIASFFDSGSLGPDARRRWWPHLEWAMQIALWDDAAGPIPPDVWGADWLAEEQRFAQESISQANYVNHIDMMSQMINTVEKGTAGEQAVAAAADAEMTRETGA